MSDVAIRVEGLGKQYRLGSRQEPYKTLRDTMARAATRPIRAARSWFQGNGHGGYGRSEQFWALKDISFDIRRGDVVGIIGRNGAGKSTLLKILSRITTPTTGHAEIRGRVASLLEVGTGFHQELTGRENIYLSGAILGMKRAEIDRRFDEIVDFADMDRFVDTPVKHYSSGMYMRLGFAVAAHLEPEVLLVDEILSVGDVTFQKKCLGRMTAIARDGRTVLFVSHNMAAVCNLCSRAIVLESGSLCSDNSAEGAVRFYNVSVLVESARAQSRAAHVIYSATAADVENRDHAIIRVETLDRDGNPKPEVATWDDVVLRIEYYSSRRVRCGSVALRVASMEGASLLLLSTQPDGVLPLTLEAGEHAVDCLIERLPLSSGEYVVGAGLAVPNLEWLWWRPELGTLTVVPRDVYGSGMAPRAPRALVAVPHHWRVSL